LLAVLNKASSVSVIVLLENLASRDDVVLGPLTELVRAVVCEWTSAGEGSCCDAGVEVALWSVCDLEDARALLGAPALEVT
jgi:hypothetical protein